MPATPINVAGRLVGPGHPCFIIAEIGINHNASLDVAKKLIEGAHDAGADAVKFQKRDPESCTPKDQWNIERDTPWGRMTYIEYRHRMEFTKEQYGEIAAFCDKLGIRWFASCWDEISVDFMEQFGPCCYKAASASLTDIPLLKKMKSTGRPLILSTGMSTMEQVRSAVKAVGTENLALAQATSTYPCIVEELNLRVIQSLAAEFPQCTVGYSGHEVGLATTEAAVALGAAFVERHITLDRAMWGTDQAASVEIEGLRRLVRNIRDIEIALGDGVKRVYESEKKPMAKLRRVM